MNNKGYQLTKEGFAELQAELDELVASRPKIAENIKTAREFGDLSENAEYQSALDEQTKAEGRISEIESVLKNATVITKSGTNGKVVVGSHVKLRNDGKTKEFQIVGTVEADPMNGKISDESPIGQALLGKKVGEEAEIVTPAETSTYKISSIA